MRGAEGRVLVLLPPGARATSRNFTRRVDGPSTTLLVMVENKSLSEPDRRDSISGPAVTERKSVDQVIDAQAQSGGSGETAKKDPASQA